LTFEYFGGASGCTEIAKTDVRYDDDAITVTLYEGPTPGAGDCLAIEERRTVDIDLEEPVDGREIEDGA
jgi:hypothetical protein